jgi:hypothetical protein
LTLNPIEPPWYGPVCQVVWEGQGREALPYPDHEPGFAARGAFVGGLTGQCGSWHDLSVRVPLRIHSKR